MHGSVDVFGPGAVVFVAVLYASWAMSAYVLLDSLRRRAVDFAGVREGRWFYAVVQGLFFAVFGLEQLPIVAAAAPWLGFVQLAMVPFAVAQQVAYLLRLVFPTQGRLDARAAAGVSSAGQEGNGPPATDN